VRSSDLHSRLDDIEHRKNPARPRAKPVPAAVPAPAHDADVVDSLRGAVMALTEELREMREEQLIMKTQIERLHAFLARGS